jgi:heme-degrading monooxygenase HmoA
VNDRFARTPEPPYWAVLFSSQRTPGDPEGYGRMSEAMARIAPEQPGYLGIESTRDESGFGITLSYWKSEAAIAAWKRLATHQQAQRTGHDRWYEDFHLRIARVERAYTKATSKREGL